MEGCDITEDMLHSVQSANIKLAKEPPRENLTVMSMDAEALFPSLALSDIMSGIWRLIMELDLEFNTFNYSEIALYLAVMYRREELVKQSVISCIPVRQVTIDGTNRSEPTLAYLDNTTYTRVINGVKYRGTEKWVWTNVRSPSKLQKKKMIAMGLMASTRTLLENHIYVFNGQLYLQKKGGPIGDNVTMISSELVMFEFVLLYKQKLLRLTLYSDVLF